MRYLPIIILAITTVFAYPIRSIRDHIKSGNLDYVDRYIQDLSEREISQADFQFLSGYMITNGNDALHTFSKIDISDLSGHLAPLLLFKRGNEQYIKNEFSLAIQSFKNLAKKYENTDYLSPAISMMVNSYLQLGFPDSAQYIQDWAFSNFNNKFLSANVKTNAKISTVYYKPQGQYTIQLGAFGKEKNANQSRKRLKNTGYSPRIDQIKVNGKTLYAVRYGYYETEKEAKIIQSKLKNKFEINSFLKKLD